MGTAALFGSLSFITVFNLRARPRRWSLDTRLVVIGMVAVQLAAMLVFASLELRAGNPLSGLNPFEALANIYFLAVNRTTGMSTVEIAALEDASVAILLPLMFIGGRVDLHRQRDQDRNVHGVARRHPLRPARQAQRAGLRARDSAGDRCCAPRPSRCSACSCSPADCRWRCCSRTGRSCRCSSRSCRALPTSAGRWGATGNLTTPGVILLTALMFIGRLGPLIVAISIPDRPQERYRYPRGRVRIG